MIYIKTGNILDYEHNVDAIVNAWNRNFIPHRLLVTHGVSKAIKLKTGYKPFDEVQKKGLLKLGEAVLTTQGNLSCKGIIHVAGIGLLWNSSYKAVKLSCQNITKLIYENNFKSIAIPLIGCGANKLNEDKCIQLLMSQLHELGKTVDIYIVRYKN